MNLTGYLDTGFFIDQRLTRRLVRRLAGGRRFLNLFAYTGTMTVNALAGGSPASTTVDLSRPISTGPGATWRRTASLGASDAGPHRLVHADCLPGLPRQGPARPHLAGPADVLQLEADGSRHLRRAARPRRSHPHDRAPAAGAQGILLFATNRRGFTLAREELPGLAVKDLSRATLAPDCARAANRHHVYQLRTRD